MAYCAEYSTTPKQMKDKFVLAYMDTARRFAELSSAHRAKVGAIIVKDNRIISIGYNGTPSGWDNDCEYIIQHHELGTCTEVTKPEVVHAELNAIAKVARSSESCDKATMFCTHMPCMECAKAIYAAGIKTVYCGQDYKAHKGYGKPFLLKAGIEVLYSGHK